MKKIIMTAFTVLFFIACSGTFTSCGKEYDCYFISEKIIDSYYPYTDGQTVEFQNEKGDKLLYTIHIGTLPAVHTRRRINCDCECEKVRYYYYEGDGSCDIVLIFSNTTTSPFKTEFYTGCYFVDTITDWVEGFIFSGYGNDRYCEKTLGKQIPYEMVTSSIYNKSRLERIVSYPTDCRFYSGGKHIQNVVHKKDIGLESFYNADRDCVWRLLK